MLVVAWVLVGITALTAVAYLIAGWLTIRQTARKVPAWEGGPMPPVTLLKPLKGLEDGLEDNLRSLYALEYPAALEVVFATTDAEDPALEVARRVAAAHPSLPSRFVLSDPDFGLNPKVANLAGALAAATHDLVLQTDANVRVPPDYLERIVADLLHQGGHLLSSMVVGVGEEHAGAALDNLHLSAFVSPATCLARDLGGVTCVIGKSMLLRRSDLDALGGLEQVKDVLAEDFVLGARFAKAGKKVILSSVPVFNVNIDASVERFLGRYARWLKMRAVIHVGGYFADILGAPVAFAALAVLASGADPRFLAILAATAVYKIVLDGLLVRRTRGVPMKWRFLLLAPLKDLMMFTVWIYSGFSRSVEWRGQKLRLGKGSFLRPDEGNLPVRLARFLVSPFRARA